jgi:hypothetical protein
MGFFKPAPEATQDQRMVDAYTIEMLRRLLEVREGQLSNLRRRVQELEWELVLLKRKRT